MRFSASSIQTSSRLAVATSPCSSHTPCAARICASEIGVVDAQFRQHVERRDVVGIVVEYARKLAMWPIERSVVPPSLRTRSAMRR